MNDNWGYFDVLASQEITLRLTNVMTSRIGGTDRRLLGTIVSQLFSGSSAINNTSFSGGSVHWRHARALRTCQRRCPLAIPMCTFVGTYTIDVALRRPRFPPPQQTVGRT